MLGEDRLWGKTEKKQYSHCSQHFCAASGTDSFSEVREALEQAGVPMVSAEVTMIPQNYVDLTSDNDVKLMNRILDMLDDDDDVQEVYHNWNQPEEEDED